MSTQVSLFDESQLWDAVLDPRSNKPRLKIARSFFRGSLKQEELPFLVDVFKYWRDFDEYLGIEKDHIHTGEKKYLFVKCSKRGNDIYAERSKIRLAFLKRAEKLEFFTAKDFDTEKQVKTRLLWITLTWNSNFCSLQEAHDTCEYHYNLFITNLRNEYGKIQVLRFPDIFPDSEGKAFGYPHFHCVLLFQDQEFTVFPRMDNEGKLEYRIHERDELKEQGKWHSWVDIRAISSMQGVHNYAVKHHENTGFGDSEEALLNNAVMWLFKKKSYTISGDFRKVYHDLIISLRNSKVFQMDLDGGRHPVWVCRLIGIFSWADLNKIKRCKGIIPWFLDFSRDEIIELFDGEVC